MSPTTRPGSTLSDPHQLAATARSIVSCPAEIDLVVDGVATVLDEDDTGGAGMLGLHDVHGAPTFTCVPGSELARAGELGRSTLMTIASGLGPVGSPERTDSLVMAGRLEVAGTEDCACCGETRVVVSLRLDFVLLSRRGEADDEQQHRVPLEHYRSPAHHLNRGFLQRSVEHANDHHQDELRRAVSLSAGTRMADVLGVRLTGLSTRGVEVSWVDPEGAHRTRIDFPRAARTTAELGELLRRELHAGLC